MVDPWALDDELQRGDAGAIDKLADVLHRSGNHVEEADDDFDKAKAKFKAGYVRNGSEHPIDESGEVSRATAALNGHREQLSHVAVNLEQCTAALAQAQRDGDAEIASLDRPDALDAVDGVPGDGPADAARQYDQSGQRARDQAMVAKAKSEGRSDADALVDQPGGYTGEEAAAAQRLHDYDVVNDHAVNDPGRSAVDVHDRVQARRLAGERLDDFNVLHSTGPVAFDPILGGDARARAQARLALQQKLENGGLSWSPQPMTPDQATHAIDQMEASDRANVLARLPGQLQGAGMSPEGAAAVVEGLTHGKIPEEYIQAAGAAGNVFDGGEKGFDKYAGLVEDHGSHWTPEAAELNAHDVEALEKIGHRIGRFGSALELGTGAYEILHGVPVGEVAAKAAGGWAGATELGGFGAGFGEFVAGPPGAFVLGLIGGTAGAFGGDWGADKVYKWLTE